MNVMWTDLGYTEDASAAAFTQSYSALQRAVSQQEPSYQVRGILTDGCDSTTKRMRMLFPGVRLGNYVRHALTKCPKKLVAIALPMRQALRSRLYWRRQRRGLRVFVRDQKLRRFADH